MTPRWFDIYGALLAKLPTLAAFADVPVYDGAPVSNEYPPTSVTVGYATAEDGAGSFQQAPDPSGYGLAETGEIRCQIAASAGDTDMSVTRSQVGALYTAWQNWLATDQTLGGLLSEQTVINLSAVVDQLQTVQGSGTGLVVTVTYQTAF